MTSRVMYRAFVSTGVGGALHQRFFYALLPGPRGLFIQTRGGGAYYAHHITTWHQCNGTKILAQTSPELFYMLDFMSKL